MLAITLLSLLDNSGTYKRILISMAGETFCKNKAGTLRAPSVAGS